MKISRISREKILDYLLNRRENFHGKLGLLEFLGKVFDLKSLPSKYDHRFNNAWDEIWQHKVNNYDWSDEYLLKDYLGLLKCNDRIFISFLEACLHPEVYEDKRLVMETFFKFRSVLLNDGYDLVATDYISGLPVFKVKETISQKKYDLTLSYASEQREYVEKVANFLRDVGVRVFYDKFEEISLWGRDLTGIFGRLFCGEESVLCVIFSSKEYKRKKWTKFEFRHALSKYIKEETRFLLVAKFDDEELEGFPSTVAYVDLRGKEPEEFGRMVLETLFSEMIKSGN